MGMAQQLLVDVVRETAYRDALESPMQIEGQRAIFYD